MFFIQVYDNEGKILWYYLDLFKSFEYDTESMSSI